MKLDKKLTQALVVGLGLYLLVESSLEVALITIGVAAIVAGMTQHLEAAVLVLAMPALVKLVNVVNEPFQMKVEPETVVKRLQEVKVTLPRQSDGPTGVLESAHILDSEPLFSAKDLASEALPGASVPASAKARVAIFAPEEKTVAATGVRVADPMANPVLQNGPDMDGIGSALMANGAMSGAADLPGIDGGAGAF
jgi:hypothetical protein